MRRAPRAPFGVSRVPGVPSSRRIIVVRSLPLRGKATQWLSGIKELQGGRVPHATLNAAHIPELHRGRGFVSAVLRQHVILGEFRMISKDETPISPLVSFWAVEDTRLVKKLVMPLDRKSTRL